ncbi:MAG: hypothetical protein AABX51_08440 [Nanoarchaeota archaeon]
MEAIDGQDLEYAADEAPVEINFNRLKDPDIGGVVQKYSRLKQRYDGLGRAMWGSSAFSLFSAFGAGTMVADKPEDNALLAVGFVGGSIISGLVAIYSSAVRGSLYERMIPLRKTDEYKQAVRRKDELNLAATEQKNTMESLLKQYTRIK